ncbi:hypothetical protein A3Q56_06846 [Intoshia linei]|uniref:RNA helicase n=1 Tax=Intoshia linei TaxID=1819745 RepID=A0A177ATY0_9BILA|nr:hypothetical protein A3Q56_06846 [Intoshia linei]
MTINRLSCLKKLAIMGVYDDNPNVDQKLVYVSTERGKTEQLKYLFSEGVKTPVLIFVQNKNRVNQLYDYLLENLTDLKVSKLHSGLTQQERDDACINLRLGKVHITVCTDVLSRGLDFRCINTVVNYDFPSTSTTYIHRIGRTGRAGRKGVAYTYFTDDDRPYLKRIANVMYKAGCDVPQYIMDMATPTISTIKKLLKGPKRKKIGSMKRFTFFRKKSILLITVHSFTLIFQFAALFSESWLRSINTSIGIWKTCLWTVHQSKCHSVVPGKVC